MDIQHAHWLKVLTTMALAAWLWHAPSTARAQGADVLHPAEPSATTSLHVGDDAPAFSLRAYNEDDALKLVKSPLVGLNFFTGIRPEYPKEVVILVFLKAESQTKRHDLATLQQLFKKYKNDGMIALAICVDKEDPQVVYGAIDRNNVSFPVLRDRFAVVAGRYDVKKYPTLFIIDKNGKIQAIGEGYQDDIEGYLDTKIRDLLAAP